ncbi:hypothetical protein FK529_05620 [Tsukamurella asaccharolytica]|uniref:Uncharacterized protein n=1 Tax=Tsukamurella asaccharolytica TaxID=2592067 RepID=A0A5C5RFB2_9ACTN|nr:hypothetical protein [Tsukamurella asaccharolytica]TWS20801.1 hypothetical protein FK529_05620 [Tsukamurella asaccharolytica]
MNAAEHFAAAERLIVPAVYESPDDRSVPQLLAAVAHGLLAVAATRLPETPTADDYDLARRTWDTVHTLAGPTFDELSAAGQGNLARRQMRLRTGAYFQEDAGHG